MRLNLHLTNIILGDDWVLDSDKIRFSLYIIFQISLYVLNV